MTVIAWDGKTLAVDRQGTYGEIRRSRSKLTLGVSGVALACTGNLDQGHVLKEWYLAGAKKEDWPAFQKNDQWTNLIVVRDGKAYEYQQECICIPVEDPFMAWGSGGDVAMGAMAMGATARKAVVIANQLCVGCGLGVDAFDVMPDGGQQ